jgi:acetyl-CoA acetyltransferase
MTEAYIIDAVRTPVGKKNGGLSKVHPADLGAHVLKALIVRTKLDPIVVVDVIFGCIDQIGPQAGDIARRFPGRNKGCDRQPAAGLARNGAHGTPDGRPPGARRLCPVGTRRPRQPNRGAAPGAVARRFC